MKFRLIFKSLDKPLFPAKHINLADVGLILQQLNGSFGCMEDTVSAIKPYCKIQKELIQEVAYKELTSAFLSDVFRQKSTRIIYVSQDFAEEITFTYFEVNDTNITVCKRLKPINIVVTILCKNPDEWLIE